MCPTIIFAAASTITSSLAQLPREAARCTGRVKGGAKHSKAYRYPSSVIILFRCCACMVSILLPPLCERNGWVEQAETAFALFIQFISRDWTEQEGGEAVTEQVRARGKRRRGGAASCRSGRRKYGLMLP